MKITVRLTNKCRDGIFALITMLLATVLLAPTTADAHCDTMDGPVILTGKRALETGDATAVLKWVKKEHEEEILNVFEKTLIVRKKGQEARELADMYFFETLVRLHRAGEGAPYTGLKPAGDIEPAITAADKALSTGSVDVLADRISDAVRKGIQERYNAALEMSKRADGSVELGRASVAAYVDYVHFIEGIHGFVSRGAADHHSDEPSAQTHSH